MNASTPFTPMPFPAPPSSEAFEVQVSVMQEDTTARIRLRFVAVCWTTPRFVNVNPFQPRAFRVWELGTFQVPDSLDLHAAEALASSALERMRDQIEKVANDPAHVAARRAGLEEIQDRVVNPFPAFLEPVEVAHG